jgi:hypothetical protein
LASRLADLLVQAAAEGTIDFSEVRFGDWRWISKIRLLVGYLDNKNRREQLLVTHANNCGFVASGSLTSKSFESLKEANSDLHNKICNTYYPSSAKIDDMAEYEINKYQLMWEERFGRLDDPEVQQKIADTCNFMESQSK